jgi:hypothetical protein
MKPIEWGGESALDPKFLDIVRHWIEQDGEVYVMYWFIRAGGLKNYYLFTSYDQFLSTLMSPMPGTLFAVDVFRHPQFPVRGWVDDEFIKRALSEVEAGKEWLLIGFDDEIRKGQIIGVVRDDHHQALIDELHDYLGKYVIIGPDIYWPGPPDDYPGEWVSAMMDRRTKKLDA